MLTPGIRLDQYELLREVAQDAMAAVWAAKRHGEPGADPRFAIKTFPPAWSADANFRSSFLKEARMASRITHPNVAQVVEAGEHDGILYLVTEWVDGCSVFDLKQAMNLEGHRMPIAAVLRVVSDACAGLHAAHEMRGDMDEPLEVMHCRLTPRKIMVGLDGTARIVDLGVGRSLVQLARDSKQPERKGTLAYMAPELATDKDFDRRADIRSLGAILYELLSSRPPYLGETDRQTISLLTSGRPPPRLGAPVPKSVEAIARRSLALDPVSRYQTAADFRTALTGAMLAADLHLSAKALVACMRTYAPEYFASDLPARGNALGDIPAVITGEQTDSAEYARMFARGVPIDVGDDKPTAAMFVGDLDDGPFSEPDVAPQAVEARAQPVATQPIEPQKPPQSSLSAPKPSAAVESAPAPIATPSYEEAPTGAVSDEQAPTGAVSDEDTPTGGVSDEDTPTGGVSDEDTPTGGVSDEDAPTGAVGDAHAAPPGQRSMRMRYVGLVVLVVVLAATGAMAARVVFDGRSTFRPPPTTSTRAATSAPPVPAESGSVAPIVSAQPSASASVAAPSSQEPTRPAPRGRPRRKGDRASAAPTASGSEDGTGAAPGSAGPPPPASAPAPASSRPPEDESGL